MAGFSRASAISVNNEDMSRDFERSPSPEEPPNQDYDAWFRPADTLPTTSFQVASSALPTVETPIAVGFTNAAHKGLLAPSSAALAKARQKMKEIWQELDSPDTGSASATSSTPSAELSESTFRSSSSLSSKKSPRRPVLHPVVNSLDSPGLGSPSTPTPAGFSRPNKPTSSMTPIELFISKNSKPFKSPLLVKKPTTPRSVDSPRTTTSNRLDGFAADRSQHPLASAPITGASSFPAIATPARHPKAPIPGSSVKKPTFTTFVTPFKPGMKPGQPGRLALEETQRALQFKQFQPSQLSAKRKADWLTTERPTDKAGREAWTGVFNLIPPPNRQNLQSSGLIPQQYFNSDLEAMGINPTELSQITPTMAKYYKFHTPDASPLLPLTSTPPVMLGPEQAFNSLLEYGCSCATQEWVDNHWGLILWKLAGMVGLDPQREGTANKRWCWAEVMRQMFYRYKRPGIDINRTETIFRYEREYNQGQRPPLRLITTRDAPAAYPMILCVSDICWNNRVYSDKGALLAPQPELEVTDGWYRIRARIDGPMARAVQRGHIRIGRKIGVAGAYLSSEKRDPSEVLDAYSSVRLVISGNSSHMMPWHAKLGFNPGPCISTLHSLTPDGGIVAAMDLVVVKVHPIAYIELVPCESRLQVRDGPMNASDEAVAHEKWKKQYEHEMSKLRTEYEKRWERYEGYLDRLERRAGDQEYRLSQDHFPQDILENMYDELEDAVKAPNVLSSLGRYECASLAWFVREHLEKEKAHAQVNMENELQVGSFSAI
ncbi:hypothetical protein H0H87_012396 [Tephrocybe sp. NHM501043]|nr:hypothetical protein H0H87_012396 [Tephrocybe sp. NHM501043]